MLLFLVKYSYSIFPTKGKNIPVFLNYSLIFIKYSLIFLNILVFFCYFMFMYLLNKNISYKGFNIKYQNKLYWVSYSVLKLE